MVVRSFKKSFQTRKIVSFWSDNLDKVLQEKQSDGYLPYAVR